MKNLPESLSAISPYLDYLGEHQYLKSIIFFALVLTIANFLKWGILKFIKKIVEKTRLNLREDIINLLEPPLFYSVVLIGGTISVKISGISDHTIHIIVALLQTTLVIFWTNFIIRGSAIVLRRVARFPHVKIVSIQTLPLFQNLILLLAISGAIYFIFSLWGIDMTAWLASAGVAGIAIGFAAKDTLANLIAGVFILADAPYQVGHYIVLKTGERGKVTQIGVRSTRILTRDDIEITVPNSVMGNSKIINQSSGGGSKKMRVKIPIGVSYDSDIDQVERILLDIAQAYKNIAPTPTPRVRLRTFGASSIDFELMVWARDPEQTGLIIHQLNQKIFYAFKDQKIEIPYAKQDLYIKELPK